MATHFTGYAASVPPYTQPGQRVTAGILRGNHVLLALDPNEPPVPCAIEHPTNGFITLIDGVPTGFPVLEIHPRNGRGTFRIYDKRTRA
jgi:hypothetical protein